MLAKVPTGTGTRPLPEPSCGVAETSGVALDGPDDEDGIAGDANMSRFQEAVEPGCKGVSGGTIVAAEADADGSVAGLNRVGVSVAVNAYLFFAIMFELRSQVTVDALETDRNAAAVF